MVGTISSGHLAGLDSPSPDFLQRTAPGEKGTSNGKCWGTSTVPVKEAEKELRNQRTSMTARQLRGAMNLGQMGLHFGSQFLAMWIDILLPTLPLSPPVWKVER